MEREQKTWDFRKSRPVLKLTPVKEKETNLFNNQKYLGPLLMIIYILQEQRYYLFGSELIYKRKTKFYSVSLLLLSLCNKKKSNYEMKQTEVVSIYKKTCFWSSQSDLLELFVI